MLQRNLLNAGTGHSFSSKNLRISFSTADLDGSVAKTSLKDIGLTIPLNKKGPSIAGNDASKSSSWPS